MTTSLAVLLALALVLASLWARRRAQGPDAAEARRYGRLSRGLSLAALAVALFSVWATMRDHRRTDAARGSAAPATQP